MQIALNKKNRLLSKLNTGFTIVEVLLALALIGLVAGLFAINFDILLNSVNKKRPEKILHEAICEARYQALQEHALIYLSYDEPKHSFLIFKDTPDHPIVSMPMENGIKVTFTPIPPAEYKSGRFSEVSQPEKPLDKITFSPDSSSQPVIITLSQDNFSLKFKPDPISCGMTSI